MIGKGLIAIARGPIGYVAMGTSSLVLIGLAVSVLQSQWAEGRVMIGVPPYAMFGAGCFGLSAFFRTPSERPAATKAELR